MTPSEAEWILRDRRHTRTRPSYHAVARKIGGMVDRQDGYALVTFETALEADAYAVWMRGNRRRPIVYTGGTAVVVKI